MSAIYLFSQKTLKNTLEHFYILCSLVFLDAFCANWNRSHALFTVKKKLRKCRKKKKTRQLDAHEQ